MTQEGRDVATLTFTHTHTHTHTQVGSYENAHKNEQDFNFILLLGNKRSIHLVKKNSKKAKKQKIPGIYHP